MLHAPQVSPNVGGGGNDGGGGGNDGGGGGGGGGGVAPAGVTLLLDDEKSESITVLFNLTVKLYDVPLDSPVTVIGDPEPVFWIELGEETAVYVKGESGLPK